MRQFAKLYTELDQSNSVLDKRTALISYFETATPADAAWALYFLLGGKLRKIATTGELRQWLIEQSGLPAWLVEDSYAHVGDLAETLSLLHPNSSLDQSVPLVELIEKRLLPVAGKAIELRRAAVIDGWQCFDETQRLVFNKFLTGALRVGVSKGLIQQALSQWLGLPAAVIAQRLMGEWIPSAENFIALKSHDITTLDDVSPYPFFLASPLEQDPEALGEIDQWQLEWKWDGIRLQLIKRNNQITLWSRGEERLDGRFPEIEHAAKNLPNGCVLDGELLVWQDNQPLPFTALQKRIQRRKPGVKLLADSPAKLLSYDLLEYQGSDLRNEPLKKRRNHLQQVITELADQHIEISQSLTVESWEHAQTLRASARDNFTEGLMLKRLDSSYQIGRKRGDWWKWKLDPLSIDAVLLYAQAGHGRRATLYTDYTFGLWDGDRLVPVAKAYSGLNDKEILELDRWIRANTIERFGPMRSVNAYHVFEIGFEAVNLSSRHKSGVAVRFPRILRWRTDKPFDQADRLDALKRLAR